MSAKKLRGSGGEKSPSTMEQQAKINEIRKMAGPITSKFPMLFSDASISRYLRARNWHTKKASKLLKETLRWRLEYKPEKIQWEDVADEAKTAKLYQADYLDKWGRTVLIMRPGIQSMSSIDVQIKYFIYCMERAIMGLKPDQEQMVWLIDFQGWNMSSISVKVIRETAHILQDHYPERLALAILYNPPKVFEPFWLMVKPFLEPKTYKKVKFVFPDDPQSLKIMEELFDMDRLEPFFGGRNSIGFEYQAYAKRMVKEDEKMNNSINSGSSPPCASIMTSELQQMETSSDLNSELSDEGDSSSTDKAIIVSNMEGAEDKIQDPQLCCNEVAKAELDAIKI
ncbi:hypothetical protein NMG60_11031133 [Bertholletia excelsa]